MRDVSSDRTRARISPSQHRLVRQIKVYWLESQARPITTSSSNWKDKREVRFRITCQAKCGANRGGWLLVDVCERSKSVSRLLLLSLVSQSHPQKNSSCESRFMNILPRRARCPLSGKSRFRKSIGIDRWLKFRACAHGLCIASERGKRLPGISHERAAERERYSGGAVCVSAALFARHLNYL